MPKNKKFSLSRGLKNVVIAPIIEDSEDAYITGDVEHLIPAGTITMSADSEKSDTYFDNVVFASTGTESATTVSIEGARLKPAQIAKITGKEVDETTGIVLDAGVYVEKYFAMGAEIGMLDGTKTLIWFLKGTFSIPEETGRTIDDSTDADGTTLEFSAVVTKYQFGKDHGYKRTVLDTTDSELLELQDWFAQVVTPENQNTIGKKKVVLTKVEITPDPVESATNGTPVSLTATADVTEGTTYAWSGTNGTFNEMNKSTAQFTPTSAGACTVTVKATNNGVTVQDTVSFTAS